MQLFQVLGLLVAAHISTFGVSAWFFGGNKKAQYECGSPKIAHRIGNSGPENARIVGGQEAEPGSWPWQAGIRRNGGQTCGGTLIGDRWVLTAAHCFVYSMDPSDYTVTLGKHRQYGKERGEQIMNVHKIYKHRLYNKDNGAPDNDIVLLHLAKTVKYKDNILPACLPKSGDVFEGHACYATGWGRTQATGSEGLLKQALLPIIKQDSCRRISSLVTDNMICSGYMSGGHDACQGDSGGPLVCRVNGVWEVHGIVSWGYGCARVNSPGYYTRVTKYIAWIRNTQNIEEKIRLEAERRSKQIMPYTGWRP